MSSPAATGQTSRGRGAPQPLAHPLPANDAKGMTAARAAQDETGAMPLPRVRKPETVRCLGPVEAGALAAQVARLSERAWQFRDSGKENRFPCFHHTRHIVFRFIDGNRDPRRFHSWPSWRLWRPLLFPVMERAAANYGLARPIYPKAMLARLESGQRIDLHVDADEDPGSHPFVHKIHVPLDTNPLAVLIVAGATTHLAAGSAWEINNLAPHGAFNDGATDRIHFIFEVFDGAGQEITEEIRPSEVVAPPADGERFSGPSTGRSRNGRATPGGAGTRG